jgi:hypothetical protein
MGRAAIGTAFREDKTARKVTLSKRKKGLYKKSQELAQLCGVDIAIICVGQFSKPSIFVASPSGEKDDIGSVAQVCQRYTEAMAGKGPGVSIGERPQHDGLHLSTESSQICNRNGKVPEASQFASQQLGSELGSEVHELRSLCGSLQEELAHLRSKEQKPQTSVTEEISRLRALCEHLQQEVTCLRSQQEQPDAEKAELAMAADRLAMLTAAQPLR